MKKYIREILILSFQIIFMFVMPILSNPYHNVECFLLVAKETFILSFIAGIVLDSNLKYFYTFIVSLIFGFIFSFIYPIINLTDVSNVIYVFWFFLISSIGLAIGILVSLFLTNKKEDL